MKKKRNLLEVIPMFGNIFGEQENNHKKMKQNNPTLTVQCVAKGRGLCYAVHDIAC